MSEFREIDVLVAGGGPAGLAATLMLARAGFETVCVDRAAPVLDPGREAADLRTTALLAPAVAALEATGAWAACADRAVDLRVMRLVEAEQGAAAARQSVSFEAHELDRPAFGANVANMDLRRALIDAISAAPGAELTAPATIAQITLREDAALLRLDDGRRLRAKLLVAADGRNSQARAAAGIAARRWDHGATAMVFTVGHAQAHGGVSVEIHRTGGPFTLVPYLDDATGRPQSSVVWMERRATAERLMALDDAALERAANERSLGVFGPLTLVSRRASWPVISLLADRLAGKRVALMGEAAHVVPPVGAQGLNMSLADAEALTRDLGDAHAAGKDIGAPETLRAYGRARYPDMAARVAATAALTIAADGLIRPVRDARALGLRALGAIAPARLSAMRFGLGA